MCSSSLPTRVTPSAVSRSISELERKLGVSLLQRSSGKILVTAEGQRYLEIIGGALETLEIASTGLAEESHSADGLVRVGVPSMYARVVLMPKLESFLASNPKINLELVICDASPDPIAQKLDLWLQFDKPETKHHIIKVIYSPPVRLVASPRYLERSPPLETPKDLEQHNCLVPHTPEMLKWQVFSLKDGHDGPTAHEQVGAGRLKFIDHIDLIYEATRAGMGIMAADIGMIIEDLRSGRLQIVLPDYAVHGTSRWSRYLCLLYNQQWIMPRRVEVVKDFLIRTAKELTESLHLIDGYQ